MSTQRVLLAVNVVLVLFIAAHFASGQPRSGDQILRGRGLELTDDRGKVRCRINIEERGEVVLRLVDQRGTIRVKLGAGEDGSGMVLLDETTEPGIHLIARRESKTSGRKTTSITLAGADGRQRVVMP